MTMFGSSGFLLDAGPLSPTRGLAFDSAARARVLGKSLHLST